MSKKNKDKKGLERFSAEGSSKSALVVQSPSQGRPSRLLAQNRSARIGLIRELEQKRNSRIIAYVTTLDREPSTQMADDVIPLFHEHLERIGNVARIDIFLYTRGGHTLTPNRLVHLIREYCDHLGVLVPFRAHSAGTTLAAGANEVVMTRLAELGPVDPKVSNDFNPERPTTTSQRDASTEKIPISVEDVAAFLTLADEKAKLGTPEAMAEAFKALCEKIHPLALGNVHRQHTLIRTMLRRQLALHMDENTDGGRIDQIVDFLTEKLYYHGYQISRKEAKDIIGLNVLYPDRELENLIWKLYKYYEADLAIHGRIEVGEGFGGIDSGIIESASPLTHSFVYPAKRSGDKIEVDKPLGRWETISD